MPIKIYKREMELGLTNIITKIHSGAVFASVMVKDKKETPCVVADKIYSQDQKDWMRQHLSPDTMLVHAILVTSDWNKNDDFFAPKDMWQARYTPVYKPVNINHEDREGTANRTIGVICDSYPVNDSYENIDSIDKMPDRFHILVGAYLWEVYWQQECAELKNKIDKGEIFVSMECLFEDFGYALRKSPDGEVILLPRNEITAWMSASLRVYGGTGKINIGGQDYQIGRWLQNYVFSGMAFVQNPANEESIVFEDYVSTQSSTASIKQINEKDCNKYAETVGIEKKISSGNEIGVFMNDGRGLNLWQ